MTFKERRIKCNGCGEKSKVLAWDTDEWPCGNCGSLDTDPSDVPANQAHGIIPDEIPGGFLVENAICNADGSPRRYYSKSAIRKAARDKGWTINGETPKDPGDTWF